MMSDSRIAHYIVGICTEMCPKKERNVREKEKLLHPLEIKRGTERFPLPLADPEKTVKEFSRSAAGKRSQSPSDLRPLPVLEETVHYLMKLAVFDRSKEWIFEYDFIFDRLRSIQQDAVIQGLTSKDAEHLFECISRFFVYSGYRLNMEPRTRYDPVINGNHLQECLKKVLCMYDEHESEYSKTSGSRPQMEAIYIAHNLGDVTALQRGISLSKQYRTKEVKVALTMSLAVWKGHYVQAMKLINACPLLLSCVAAVQIPKIRRKAFQVMSLAYSCKSLSYPAEHLMGLLLYSCKKELIEDCKHYNICYEDGRVIFSKGTFNENADAIIPRPLKPLDDLLQNSKIAEVLINGKES